MILHQVEVVAIEEIFHKLNLFYAALHAIIFFRTKYMLVLFFAYTTHSSAFLHTLSVKENNTRKKKSLKMK